MATLDFTPLYHSTVGFDRLPALLAHALTRDETGYPPYNIEKTGDDAYRIVMALAGFSRDDIEIVSERNRLSVRGALKGKNESTYLHQGIAQRIPAPRVPPPGTPKTSRVIAGPVLNGLHHDYRWAPA